MPHLFTYGTLMFPEIWRVVVGKDLETTPATLPDYQIYRVAGALYPGIIATNSSPSGRGRVRELYGPPPSALHTPPSSVPGLVYCDLDPDSLARLDDFEGHEYIRQSVTIITAAGHELPADAYIIPPDRRDILTNEIWTAEDFLARGLLPEFVARYAGFNKLD